MRSSTASETLAGALSREDERLDSAPEPVAGQAVNEEAYPPRRHRAALGILIGIVLGAGAWVAIWLVVSALWHRG
jgi:ferric-dicitrate binding protein FerR (iron transport regulator)